MSRQKRVLKTTIFIACEGKNTERVYFEAITEEMASENYYAVTIYPDSTEDAHKSHGLGLVTEAQSRMGEFDEVWAVFDKDGYTKHLETFQLANTPINGKVVNIAFSSIAFEQWVLLHFAKSNHAYANSGQIIGALSANNYFDGYEKTSYQNTYSQLRDKTIIALENAAWLKHHLALTGVLPPGPIYQVNPYTDVDVLVRRLLQIDETIHWTSVGQAITVGHITLIVTITSANSLTVTISNNGPITLLYNAINITNYFYLLDGARQISQFTLRATITIEPGQTNNILLTSAIPINGLYFNSKHGNTRIMAEI